MTKAEMLTVTNTGTPGQSATCLPYADACQTTNDAALIRSNRFRRSASFSMTMGPLKVTQRLLCVTYRCQDIFGSSCEGRDGSKIHRLVDAEAFAISRGRS